jgi:chaperone modulatory protein CbpM
VKRRRNYSENYQILENKAIAKANLISASDFCVYHNINLAFISNLKEFGLVEIVHVQQADYIPENQIDKLERMIRLHRELEINPDGLDTIDHLL